MSKKITICNVLKVGDIESELISPDFSAWLADKGEPTYIDTYDMTREHLYNTNDLWEMVTNEQVPAKKHILAELDQITEALKEHECSYFRIITN